MKLRLDFYVELFLKSVFSKVRECFDNFLTEHPNGKMKKGDLRDMLEKVFMKYGFYNILL